VDPDRARDRLTAELAELDERARFAQESRADAADDSALGEGALSQHTGEYGADVTSRMEDDLLVETVVEQRRLVREALARIEDGTYGRCAVCKREIDDERLDARPEVATCREHADAPVLR
jgi:RNA polymerase-binding transcription factor DksA